MATALYFNLDHPELIYFRNTLAINPFEKDNATFNLNKLSFIYCHSTLQKENGIGIFIIKLPKDIKLRY